MTAEPGQVGLRAAQGHADDGGAVAGCGVQGQRTPPATHIEEAEPAAFVQAQLPADQVVLRLLSVFQPGGGPGEAGARIGHAGPEHQAVELVADVVVVTDHLSVPALGMQPASR